jgi:hypothetical protein
VNRKPTWNRRLIGALAFGLLFAGCGKDAPTRANSPPKLTDASAEAAAASDNTTAGAAMPALLHDELLAEGWISLFDGETLFGWQHANQADWRVEDGAIVVEQGEKGLLVTTTEFADYILHVDFLCPAGTNSGIFLATGPDPGDVATDCYELNIAGADNPFPTGSLVNRQAVKEDLNRSQWQTYEVHVQSGHIVVSLDEKKVLEYTDPKPVRRGHIGLQLNKGRVAFRNIRLRPLGLESIFNGRDLSGWKSYPAMPSKFTVSEDGNLNVQNGRGQLETERQYGDFVLQLECISHAPGLNSGIFFRCAAGEEMNGYESQIHNGFKNGDRSQPVDCGTGGIFRRISARRVVADDLKWFHKTIIADGPHVAVWVNGYQVTDWIDTRPADPNPRKGLRLEPGTIMIQGHDPTTNLSFRQLRAGELGRSKE